MVQAELNRQVAQNTSEALAVLFVDNPDTRKRIRKIIREELKDAAKRLREDAKYEMDEDPRKAFLAVKSSIYRKILGGNVSILNPRKAGARYQLVRPRKLDQNPRQHGGNRRKRSERTNAIDSYFGKDRAFILRFVNNGTNDRQTRYGNRGRISVPGNWFPNMSQKELELAAENLANIMEEELAEAFGEMNKNK
jgi:hypothetical protein